MTNAELVKALRVCGDEPYDITKPCKVSPWKLMRDAADSLEAADKRIAELESNNPIVESVLVDKLNQRIAKLEAQMKTVTEYHALEDGER